MYFTALDIGSSKIKALVAEISNEGKMSLLGTFNVLSRGIRKGEITDFEEATKSIGEILFQIRNLNKAALKNIFVNVGSHKVRCQSSRGIVAIARADGEVSYDDIDRVVKASQAIKLPDGNRMILHAITREFILDGVNDIRDPLGMTGTRLEVNSLVINAFAPNVKDIIKCVENCGGDVAGLIYSPLAASRSVLSKNQKDLGVVLIDLGAGTTALSIYEEGKLLHAATFPIGGGNITNDLAIGLKCSVDAAELIKIFFGSAKASDIGAKEKISAEIFKEKTGKDLKDIDKNFRCNIARHFVGEIIEDRLSEIFDFINDELKLIGRAHQLPAGAIICGGGAKMPGIVDLARAKLRLPIELSLPDVGDMEFFNSEDRNLTEESEFAVASGLLLWASDQMAKEDKWSSGRRLPINFGKILKYFMP
ncbi:MAG: cell division protein FtsA [Patescibacteria group bacterium]|mgnify:CR=1 FL=1